MIEISDLNQGDLNRTTLPNTDWNHWRLAEGIQIMHLFSRIGMRVTGSEFALVCMVLSTSDNNKLPMIPVNNWRFITVQDLSIQLNYKSRNIWRSTTKDNRVSAQYHASIAHIYVHVNSTQNTVGYMLMYMYMYVCYAIDPTCTIWGQYSPECNC